MVSLADTIDTISGGEPEPTVIEVSTFSEMQQALNSPSMAYDIVRLTADLTDTSATASIPSSRGAVTLDLNGHTIICRSSTTRGFTNQGDLTVENGIIKNNTAAESCTSYGIFDNYGTLTLKNLTLVDYGANNGATLKNRNNLSSLIVMEGVTVDATVSGTSNIAVSADNGTFVAHNGSVFRSTSENSAAIWVTRGQIAIGGEVSSAAPVIIDGGKYGLEMDSAVTAEINDVMASASSRYALYALGSAKVTVRSATAAGGSYGFYTQGGDVAIYGGRYSGNPRGVFLDGGNLAVYGGFYDFDMSSYVQTGYVQYSVVDSEGATVGYLVEEAPDGD